MARSAYRPPHARRALGALALLLGFAGSAVAQSAVTPRLTGPRASVVWTQRAAGDTAAPARIRSQGERARRGLAIGGVVGGLASAFLMYRVCRDSGDGPASCRNVAIWWGTAGGLLGALIGATSARNEE
jgi:hypothetical protein